MVFPDGEYKDEMKNVMFIYLDAPADGTENAHRN